MLIKKHSLIFIFIGVIGLVNFVNAEQTLKPLPIHMSALNFPGAIQLNKKGAFDLLITHLNQLNAIDMQYDVLLPARGARIFYQHKADCVIPGTLYSGYYEEDETLFTVGFSHVDYVAFTLPPNDQINDKTQLSGKIIGVVRGEGKWDLKKRLAIPNASYVELADIKSLVGMLIKGRIDVVLHDSAGVLKAFESFKNTSILYDKTSPILVDALGVVCHKNERTVEYINRINAELIRIVRLSEMKNFYRKVEWE